MKVEIADDWLPTADNINSLPDALRLYIMQLETICDPAGDVLEHHQLKQQAAGVEAMYLAEKTDAARWRALLAALPTYQGSAGLEILRHIDREGFAVRPHPAAKGYIHAGVSFTTQSNEGAFLDLERRHQLARDVLTAIADQVISQGGEALTVAPASS
jgi:hypothetical protein